MNRYARQILFKPIGEQGQRRLAESRVLVVGVGALGTVISNHLVRAGVGNIRLIDRDVVEPSNLQRQMLFDESDVANALPKAIAAKEKLSNINSQVQVEAIVGHVSNENIEELTKDVDIVLDGTDNFATRFLMNDICFQRGIPYAYGGVVSSRGMTALFIPHTTACLRCHVKEGAGTGQTCDTVGVISPVVDIISSLQVTEALKYLTGNLDALRGTLQTIDIWGNQSYDISLQSKDSACPVCTHDTFPALERSPSSDTSVLCGRNTVQIHQKQSIDLAQWGKQLSSIADVKQTPFLLKAHVDAQKEFVLFPDGRVLVQGTEDPIEARAWYDRYIGS